jgi:hypothetical protein
MFIKKNLNYMPILTLSIMLILLSSTVLLQNVAADDTGIIYSDSSDGTVRSDGLIITGQNTAVVGDGNGNRPTQAFFKFEIPEMMHPGGTLRATLYIFLNHTRVNNTNDYIDPLQNPGLGDCLVRHIDDYITLGLEDLNSPSIGNDPGVLITGSETPNKGYISIDVTEAMQDDVDSSRTYTTFMIKTALDTDNNSDEDRWRFSAYEHNQGQEPYIEYKWIKPVGGELLTINKLQIIAPYLLMLAFIATATALLLKKRLN